MKGINLIFSLLAITFCNAQEYKLSWAHQIGGDVSIVDNNDIGMDVETDIYGNVYTIGIFDGTFDFDPDTSVYNLTSVGESDIFIQKLDANGHFIWAKQLKGGGLKRGYSLTIDNNENVYLTGCFTGTVDFDTDLIQAHVMSSVGEYDIFVQKLDATGDLIWARQMGSNFRDVGNSIIIDDFGNVYTTGFFSGTVDFDPSPTGIESVTTTGGYDVFVQKLDPNGMLIWNKTFGGPDRDQGHEITIDNNGDLLIGGNFKETADFDPGPGVVSHSSAGSEDIFVEKLDADGNLIWARIAGGTNLEYAYAIATDIDNSTYLTGKFQGVADFDPGSNYYPLTPLGSADVFVQKLDVNGNFKWAKQIGGDVVAIAQSIATDSVGDVYIGGYFSGLTDFDPGPDTFNLTGVGNSDFFIEKLDSTGQFIWVAHIGGDELVFPNSIWVDEHKNVYSTGSFTSSADFNPSNGTYNLTASGWDDIFVLKMKACVSDISISMNDSTLTANNPNGTYQWLDCHSNYTPIPGETNQSFIMPSNGQYAVAITENGCTDTSECIIMDNLGLATIIPVTNFIVYPNPANDYLHIDCKANIAAEYTIQILDNSGKIVQSYIEYIDNKSIIDVQNLSPGFYTIRISGPDSIPAHQQKIMMNR